MLKLASAVLLLAACAPASAGVVMEFTDKSPGDPAPEVSRAWGGTDRVRVEAGGQVIIFRGDKNVAWIVDPRANTYMELTEGGVPGMADALKEMEASLASMPPEQRAMVEAMMKQHGGGAGRPSAAAPAAIAWSANGTSDTVGGHACRGWDGTRGGRVEEQVCAAEWTTFGLTEADFAAFQRFADFMKTMTGPMAQGQRALVDSAIPGIPLRSITKSPQGDLVHEVTKIEKADVAASLFELPAGAKLESMGEAPPARGRR